MTKNAKRPAKPATKPPAEVPAWVTEDPNDIDYWLHAFHEGECHEQRISMTREEFKALKVHLATLRGYVVPKAA